MFFFSEKHSVERTFSDESTSVPNMIEDQISNQPVIERHSVLHESFNTIVKSSEVSEQPRESSSTLLTTRNLKAQSVLRARLVGFPFPSPTEIPLDFDAYLVEFTKKENASIGLSLVPALSDRFLGFFQVLIRFYSINKQRFGIISLTLFAISKFSVTRLIKNGEKELISIKLGNLRFFSLHHTHPFQIGS